MIIKSLEFDFDDRLPLRIIAQDVLELLGSEFSRCCSDSFVESDLSAVRNSTGRARYKQSICRIIGDADLVTSTLRASEHEFDLHGKGSVEETGGLNLSDSRGLGNT